MKYTRILLVAIACIGATAWAADKPNPASFTYKVLYKFPKNGELTSANGYLVFDTAGNLYGAGEPGLFDWGAVYELSPSSAGQWIEQVLYSFSLREGHDDDTDPLGGLILDSAGNLYGTGYQGGSHNCGGVFQLTPQWTENVLAKFKPKLKQGCGPYASLVFDASGNLYGTAQQGGTYGGGTAFELSPGANGTWTDKVIHSFNNNGKDGWNPYWVTPVFDKAGNLYGATYYGGTSTSCPGNPIQGCGTVFELIPGSNGKWSEKVLHSFQNNGKDGYYPFTGLTIDGQGNLYGVTYNGGTDVTDCGPAGCGAVFEVSPASGGKWTEKVLHSFNSTKGSSPRSPLLLDSTGNLYGSAASASGGVVFELIPDTNGKWTEKVLLNGIASGGVLISDGAGNLYGADGAIIFELVRSAK
jgi:uncharacterized repeat protein (TIGR03803 family)